MMLRATMKGIFVFAAALVASSPALAQAPAPAAKAAPQSAAERLAELYDIFSSAGGRMPDWDKARSYFLKEAVVAERTTPTTLATFDLEGFIRDVIDFYVRPVKFGAVTLVPLECGFSDRIVRMKSREFGDTAHVLVLFETFITGSPVEPTLGVDSWLLGRRDGRWLVLAVTNELVSSANPIPPELRDGEARR